MIEFLDEQSHLDGGRIIPTPVMRKGFYYRALGGGNRLYFSENEIADVVSKFGYYLIVLHNGAKYRVQSSVPDHVEFEAPYRNSTEKDYFYVRS